MDFACFLENYGYLAVFAGALLEGETVLLLAGFLAHQGYMQPPGVVLAALGGSLASDQLMFLLGRCKGPALLARFPRLARGVEKAAPLVRRHQRLIILTFRFMYGLRNFIPFFLGLNKTPLRLFIPLNLSGAAVWASGVTAAGYFFGQVLQAAFGHFQAYEPLALALLFLVVAAIWLIRRHGAKKAANPEHDKKGQRP